jgi:3-oxoacyl-(acyl-carrier-protein) synthase
MLQVVYQTTLDSTIMIGYKVEFDALLKIFRNAIPRVSVNKSRIGHDIGASSGIEEILAMV